MHAATEGTRKQNLTRFPSLNGIAHGSKHALVQSVKVRLGMLWTIHRINAIRPGRDNSPAVLSRPYNERSNLLPELRTTVCSTRQARAPR